MAITPYLFFEGRAEEALDFYVSALSATVQMPIGPTFWSPAFGVVLDRFGVSWMIGVQTEAA